MHKENNLKDSDEQPIDKEIQVLSKNHKPKSMSFTGHLEELRQAIIISAFSLTISSSLCFYYYKQLLDLLTAPLTDNVKNVELVFLSPGEAFMATVRVAIIVGMIFALPIILNRIYWFIAPGLTKEEKHFSLPIITLSYFLFLIGIVFSYKLLLPFGVKFLVEFAPSNIHAMISIGNYISFSSSLLLGTGLIFELPLVLLFLAFINIVSVKLLKKYRRHAFLGSFIIGAIITPSVDMITQALLAGALYALYEISIIAIGTLESGRRKKLKNKPINKQ